MSPESIVHLLPSATAGELKSALEKDGFKRVRGYVYAHADGRVTVLHFHHSRDTLTRKTLKSLLDATAWTEDDARRLGLLK